MKYRLREEAQMSAVWAEQSVGEGEGGNYVRFFTLEGSYEHTGLCGIPV